MLLRVQCIGVGRRGAYNLRRLTHFGAQIAAIADVKSEIREPIRRLPVQIALLGLCQEPGRKLTPILAREVPQVAPLKKQPAEQ